MFLKMNWSVKTPWHRLSIGDACSVLYMDSLPKTWNPGLYFLYCALTVEKSSEMHLHYCLNLRVFGSSLGFDQDLASTVLSKMECILLIQNCTSKMVANFMILSLLLIFQYFSVYGYFYEKIDLFGLCQLGLSRLCSWNAGKLLTGMPKRWKKIAKNPKKKPPKFLYIFIEKLIKS